MRILSSALLTLGLAVTGAASAGPVVVSNDTDYQVAESTTTQLIFASPLEAEAQHGWQRLQQIEQQYQHRFGYSMDETLRVGLLSTNNQIANGFMLAQPFNMQMNYIGGAQSVDYFAASSWLDTLLYHETAHNYQINAKDNPLSRTLHQLLGNNAAPVFASVVPFFTYPNIVLPGVFLEGNATFNESTFGNGGRLFSGRARALLMSQLKANQLSATRLINTHLEFPYYEEKYLLGGYFWLYLAQRYGIEQTNRFFLNNSGHFINPFRTNHVFKRTFGRTFIQLVDDFIASYQPALAQYRELDATTIAVSQYLSPMNRSGNQLLFLLSDGKQPTRLATLDSHSAELNEIAGPWLSGKPFMVAGQYVTAASYASSPERISMGLFNQQRVLQDGSDGRIYQTIDGDEALYFDLQHGFTEFRLLRNGELVDKVHSSALLSDQGEPVYFKQQGAQRTLYRGGQALLRFNGHYGFPVAAQQGRVYFIGPTSSGSSLFVWHQHSLQQLFAADNILDARPLDDGRWLLATIHATEYRFQLAQPTPTALDDDTLSQLYAQVKLDQPSPQPAPAAPSENEPLPESRPYQQWQQTRFSSLYPVLGYDETLVFNLLANWTDPLRFHSISAFAQRDNDRDLSAGLRYSNQRNRLNYGGMFYHVWPDTERSEGRDYGGELTAQYPLFQHGLHQLNLDARWYADDDYRNRNPFTLALSYQSSHGQPLRMWANRSYHAKLLYKQDRGDNFTGAEGAVFTALANDFYVGVNGKWVYSAASTGSAGRGIRITRSLFKLSADVTDFEMLALSSDFQVKTAWQTGATLRKQFDGSRYFFTFPFSLRREALYLNANYYQLRDFSQHDLHIGEYTLGATFDLLFLNSLPLPLSAEYIYNTDTRDPHKFRLLLAYRF